MREFTEIKVVKLNYDVRDFIESKRLIYFAFDDPLLTRRFVAGRVGTAKDGGILIFETQGADEAVSLEEVNSGLAVELFFDHKRSLKICDGFIHRRYFAPAKSTDWKVKESLRVNENCTAVDVDFVFSEYEKSLLSYGVIPLSMDHKWFSYMENNTIHFVRSWTGVEIFRAELIQANNNTWRIEKLYANTDQAYSSLSTPALFERLIRGHLIRMEKMKIPKS